MIYRVNKHLELHVDIEAESPEEAIDKMLGMDDNTFMVDECDYEAVRLDGKGNVLWEEE